MHLIDPSITLRIMSDTIDLVKIMRKVDIENRRIPSVKTFFLPIMSPSLPKGIRKIAVDKI